MTTHAQRTSGHRPSRLVIAVRTWTLLIFMLLSGVGSFLAGWIVADTHYGETGLWVGLAVGVVVAVGTILGVRRSVHAPQKRKGGILAIVGAVGLVTLLRAFDLTIILDPMGGFIIGLSGYLCIHTVHQRVRQGPALWDNVAARRQTFRQARR